MKVSQYKTTRFRGLGLRDLKGLHKAISIGELVTGSGQSAAVVSRHWRRMRPGPPADVVQDRPGRVTVLCSRCLRCTVVNPVTKALSQSGRRDRTVLCCLCRSNTNTRHAAVDMRASPFIRPYPSRHSYVRSLWICRNQQSRRPRHSSTAVRRVPGQVALLPPVITQGKYICE